jgi:hypothetical protein
LITQLKKKTKPALFQVLLLDNDYSEDVKVQETKQVDFCHVKKHLKNGGSVFITSTDSQKLSYPKGKCQKNYFRSRRIYRLPIRHHLKTS